ncbi:MAG: putative 5-3 exonuclease [Acidimicrobiia bacterium]|nr:putative 5-3 exonuclease [Acidimicrobiia bacterium]
MQVHLIDGTYELFRQHFGRPDPGPYGAVIGAVRSTIALLDQGATHIGVATDHVIESFRNDLWPTYKTSEGMPPELLVQFPMLEEALEALGVTVWAMTDHEADDAMGAAAAVAEADARVSQVIICTPDKDLGQCVRGQRVVQLDRRNGALIDEAAVMAKFGVTPASIPDYLALVGDSADGFPGLPGWGAKSAGAVLHAYGHLENIPRLADRWTPTVRGAAKLAITLADNFEAALLFRKLATLVTDLDVGTVDDWQWRGPTPQWPAVCEKLGDRRLADRARGPAQP